MHTASRFPTPRAASPRPTTPTIFTNAAEALELWTQTLAEDGGTVPEPRDLSALRSDPAWLESFAGAPPW